MSGTKSKTQRKRKPYPDFPLTWHSRGLWCKKIKGKIYYFGEKGCEPDVALAEYLDVRDDLFAGRDVRRDGLGVAEGLNLFIADRKHRLDSGDIVNQTFKDYVRTCKLVVEFFGRQQSVAKLRPSDFNALRMKLSETRGAIALGNEVQRVRVAFKFLYDSDEIDAPIKFGPSFKKPSAKARRIAKNDRPDRSLSADEIKSLIGVSSPQMRAMILLGINCGFGNHDCAVIKHSNLDRDTGWVVLPRPKTGTVRRCKLWRETLEAIDAAIDANPPGRDKATESHLFITTAGNPWVADGYGPVSQEFRKLVDQLGIHRQGVGFYALRHVFETVGGDTKDQVAVDFLMGHAREDMASHYRNSIEDQRLVAVTDHIYKWLGLGKAKKRRAN